MEILVGMILLSQAFVFIQLMREHKQRLQQMETLKEKLVKLEKALESQKQQETKPEPRESKINEEKKAFDTMPVEVATIGKSQVLTQEALINEVLSEVFS